MRNCERRKQFVWFVDRTRDDSGIEPTYVYGKPQKYRMSVSADMGSANSLSIGIVPSYERYIVSYKKDMSIVEGMYVYVDRTPEIDAQGDLVLDSNDLPTVYPDYVVDTINRTQKGIVMRINIKKASADEND